MRIRTLLVTLAILGAAASRAATASGAGEELPSAEKLFERHLEASGGRKARLAHHTVSIRGKLELPQQGLTVVFERFMKAPNQYRNTVTVPGVGVFEEGHDGQRFWSNDPIKGARLRRKEALPQLRWESDFYSDVNYARYYSSYKTLRRTTFGDVEVYQVEALPKEGAKQYLYFDVKSGFRIGKEGESLAGDAPAPFQSVASEHKKFGDLVEPTKIDQGNAILHVETVVLDAASFPSMEMPNAVAKALAAKSVSGVVRNKGRPVAGAHVRLTERHEEVVRQIVTHSEETEREMTAASDGSFRFEAVNGEHYWISASEGTNLGEAGGQVPERGDVTDLVIELKPGVAFRGQVIARDGKAIAGARLIASSGCIHYGSLKTDVQGHFEWVLETGSVEITAYADGYLPKPLAFDVTPGKRVDKQWQLEAATLARGVVLDGDGRPVEGVELVLLDEAGPEPRAGRSTIAHAKSTAGGTFAFDTATPGEHKIQIHERGVQTPQPVRLPSDRLKVVLNGATRLKGVVLDEKGEPQANGEVLLAPAGSERGESYDQQLRANTDAGGSFSFDHVPPGRYQATVYLPSLRTTHKEIDVPARGEISVDLKFEAGLPISGTVVDDQGQPLFGVEIEVHSVVGARPKDPSDWIVRDAVSDANGRFRVDALPQGSYDVKALRKNKRGTVLGHGDARAAAGSNDVRMVLPRVILIRGRLVDEAGRPVSDARINDDLPLREASGVFEVATHDGGLEIVAEGFVHKSLRPALGQRSEIDLGDVVLSKGKPVRVRVVAAEGGTPVKGAIIYSEERLSKTALEPAATNANGEIELPNMGPDPVSFHVRADGYIALSTSLTGKQELVEIALTRGAVIHGRVLDRSGKPVSGAEVSISSEEYASSWSDARGAFTLEGVAPGRVTLTARVPVTFAPKVRPDPAKTLSFSLVELEVSGAQPVEVTVNERVGGANVRVRSVDDSGAPVEAQVTLMPGSFALPNGDARTLSNLLQTRGYRSSLLRPASESSMPSIPLGTYTLVVATYVGTTLEVYAQPLSLSTEGPTEVLAKAPATPRKYPLLSGP